MPIDDRGMMLINYAGGWRNTFTHYSFKYIFDTLTSSDYEELTQLKDAIIIVSNAASGYDIKPIPIENNYPGGGIYANIINTILTGNFLTEVTPSMNIIIIFVISIIISLCGLFTNWPLKILSFILLLSGYTVISFYVFKSFGIVLQVVSPSIAILLSSMFVSFYQIQSQRGVILSLSKEKKELEEELACIGTKIIEKNNKISSLMTKLTDKNNHNTIQQLKDELRTEKDEKENLEKEKIMLIRKLSPLEIEDLRKEAERFHIITRDRGLLEAFDLGRRVASSDHGVLLLGESGTGKELFVNAIHAMSRRNRRTLVKVNVASIVPTLAESELFGHVKGAFAGADRDRQGLFEKADKGTIFLDEIGDLFPDIQAKLLRILQDGEIRPVGSSTSVYIDVRVIAATDKNLDMEVRAGRFNKALFARLNRYPIILPPLKERAEDIPYLVDAFIRRHKEGRDISGISKEAIEILYNHSWPENVRQLENVIIRSLINTQNIILQSDDIQYAIK
ncbi:MAG: sigma 54-interacting transcriptional regulator [bacterium]